MGDIYIFFFRCIKVALLPISFDDLSTYTTSPLENLNKPTIGETFRFNVPVGKLCTKTLQINIWSICSNMEECLVSNILYFNRLLEKFYFYYYMKLVYFLHGS